MPRLKPCWSCGAQDRACYSPCDCAKCVDPDDYNQWRYDNPEDYRKWLKSQRYRGGEGDF